MARMPLRRSLPATADEYDNPYPIADQDEFYVTRPHTSVRRYQQPVPRDTEDQVEQETPPFLQRRRSGAQPVTDGGMSSRAVNPPASSGGRTRSRYRRGT